MKKKTFSAYNFFNGSYPLSFDSAFYLSILLDYDRSF